MHLVGGAHYLHPPWIATSRGKEGRQKELCQIKGGHGGKWSKLPGRKKRGVGRLLNLLGARKGTPSAAPGDESICKKS